MEKQQLIEACATPIQMADKQPIATTISEIIDCIMVEYDKGEPIDEGKINDEVLLNLIEEFPYEAPEEHIRISEKIAKAIASLVKEIE